MLHLIDLATGQAMNDQVALGFVQQQLFNVEQTVYARKYQESDYRRHITVVTEGSEWAQGSIYYSSDSAGRSKWINGASTDIPFLELSMNQYSTTYQMGALGYQWNIEELNQAILARRNIGDEKATEVRKRVERDLYEYIITGNSEKNWTGLVNDPTVFSSLVAATGTGASPRWANKTPDQILFDINQILVGIKTTTNQIEWADTLRLPPSALQYISSTRLGNGDGSLTIFKFIQENNVYTAETGQPLNIGTIVELETAGAGGTGRMMAYRNEREVVRVDLPKPFRFEPPRSRSILGYEVGGTYRIGPVQVRLPGAMRYADGITGA